MAVLCVQQDGKMAMVQLCVGVLCVLKDGKMAKVQLFVGVLCVLIYSPFHQTLLKSGL